MLLDTNTIIRFITNDPKSQALSVKKVVQAASDGRCQLTLLPMILAECVFVLHSFYKLDRLEVSLALSTIVKSPEITVDEPDVVLKALELFGNRNLDFVDCYLSARSLTDEGEVLSFDKYFGKVADVKWISPTKYK